jgi:hypothetical protein
MVPIIVVSAKMKMFDLSQSVISVSNVLWQMKVWTYSDVKPKFASSI